MVIIKNLIVSSLFIVFLFNCTSKKNDLSKLENAKPSDLTTVYTIGDSTFWKNVLTHEAILQLNNETQKLEPEGYELANIFLKYLVENGPVDINAFNIIEKFEKDSSVIDNLMHNKVSLLGGYDPQDVGSPINWYYTPKGDLQWPTHLSRHYWLEPLARAWRVTKDPVYSQKIVDILLDWIDKNAIGNDGLTWGSNEPGTINKGGAASEGFFHNYVDGPWTSLSAHSRVHYWTYLLTMIYDSPQMTNRNISVIFNSLSNDHRNSMINHPRRMNQYIAIATSLVNLGWYYPFLNCSSEAGKIGMERVQHFALTEIYPDGSMAECSPNYAKGSLERVYKVVQKDQLQGGTLFKELDNRICKAVRYFYLSSDPQGNSPRIAKGRSSVLTLIEKVGTNCNDPQIQYLYSKREEGQKPAFLSKAYNWAGHIIFRSDWSEDATWLFFEPGPRGSGHADVATLNLQLQSKGEWLLTDPGYFSYSNAGEDGKMAKYMSSTAAHNLALVDKQNQIYFEWGKGRAYNSKPGTYNWSDNGKIAYAEGSYDFGFGEKGKIKVTHKRQITYNREQDKFTIKDIFEGTGDHQIDLHWQLPPIVEFKKDNSSFSVTNGRATAQFSIACNKSFSIKSVKGSKSPLLGWFSLYYGELEPSTTVKVLAEGKLPITFTTEIDID